MTEQDLRMKRDKTTYYLVILSVLSFLGGTHKYFQESDARMNFLIYDYVNNQGTHGKLLSNIVYEISYLVTVHVLLLLWRRSISSVYLKNAISPFIWITFFDICDYICYHKQLSYVKLPFLGALIIYYVVLGNPKLSLLWKKLKNIWIRN